MPSPTLIAHRGYPACYPENTLLGIAAAVDQGAKAVEFDVQLSADEMPLLFHDSTFKRVTGCSGSVMRRSAAHFKSLPAAEPARFGTRFAAAPLNTLQEAVVYFKTQPQVTFFLEFKAHSLRHFGVEKVAETVLQAVQPVLAQCVFISFEIEVLRYLQQRGQYRLGWVLRRYDHATRQIAERLRSDFLFLNAHKVPGTITHLWPGVWQWALYVVDDWESACRYAELGATYIETDNIGAILQQARSWEQSYDAKL